MNLRAGDQIWSDALLIAKLRDGIDEVGVEVNTRTGVRADLVGI